MGIEIERKFLVNHEKWNRIEKPEKEFLRQGYLLNDSQKSIRVRVKGSTGFLTIKSPSKGATRQEFEFKIPLKDAEQLPDNFTVSGLIKNRYTIEFKGKDWEVDEFLGDNLGLIVAEIELKSESDPFELPDWIEREVTHEEKYFNSNLATHPFQNWNPGN